MIYHFTQPQFVYIREDEPEAYLPEYPPEPDFRMYPSERIQPEIPSCTQSDLLPTAVRKQRVSIIASQDSGKTTLVNWIVAHRIMSGWSVICLDTHSFRAGPANGYIGKYPDSCKIFSTIEEIRNAVHGIRQMIDSRYAEYEAGEVGERQHPPILVVAEEFPEIAEEDYETLALLKSQMMRRARKVHLDYLETGQADTVALSGTRGKHQLNTFDLKIELMNINGVHRAWCTFAGDKSTRSEYRLPGPYPGHQAMGLSGAGSGDQGGDRGDHRCFSSPPQPVGNTQNHHLTGDRITGDHHLKTTSITGDHHEEDRIAEAFRSGWSKNRIFREFWGGKNPERLERLNSILRKAGLI